jgi:serine protease Do
MRDEQNRSFLQRLASRGRVALLAGAIAIGASSLAWTQARHEADKRPTVTFVLDDKPVSRDNKNGITSFAPVVKKVTPSVVKVLVASTPKNVTYDDMFPDHPFFRRFFGEEFGRNQSRREFRMPKQHGLGSGVIVSEDGYILTNNHVVDNADEVKVALTDGREFTAKVIGKDPKTDIAVLKIDASDLPALPIANSDNIEVGDLVLAVGNPFGVGQTVTMGMVSATGRGNLGLDYEDFIQTDAAINPGNSGGALVDAEGRLVGINTAILSRSGGNQGIGFAVPVNLARDVMESLIRDGRVVRGFLGVGIQDLNPALAKEFDLDRTSGVVVTEVTPDSPAAKAGLKSGDIITEFGGREVRDSRHLKLQVAQAAPGKTVAIKVLRDGKARTLQATPKELPGSELAAKGGSGSDPADKGTLNGVTVSDLDEATRAELKVPRHVQGVLVTDVRPDSPSYQAGLRAGDVILEIDRRQVDDAEEAVKLTERDDDNRSLLRVWSKGGTRYVVVDESKAG